MSDRDTYRDAYTATAARKLAALPTSALRTVAERGARDALIRNGAPATAATFAHVARVAAGSSRADLLSDAIGAAPAYAHGADGADATARSVDRAVAARLATGDRVMDRAVSGALHRVTGKVKVRGGSPARGPSTGAPRPATDWIACAVHDAKVRAADTLRALAADYPRAKGRDGRRAIVDKVRAITHGADRDVRDAAKAAGFNGAICACVECRNA